MQDLQHVLASCGVMEAGTTEPRAVLLLGYEAGQLLCRPSVQSAQSEIVYSAALSRRRDAAESANRNGVGMFAS
jgi:hypothetical protein